MPRTSSHCGAANHPDAFSEPFNRLHPAAARHQANGEASRLALKPRPDLRAAGSPGTAALGRAPSEIRPEILPRVARLARGYVFGRPGSDDMATGVPTFGTEIN